MSKTPPNTSSGFYTEVITYQNMFCNFCYQTKNEGPHVSLFPFVSSPWRNCPKIEEYHSIEMVHLNFSKMLFNIN